MENLEAIRKHNEQNISIFKIGINQFSDLTFLDIYEINGNGSSINFNTSKLKIVNEEDFELDKSIEIPDSFDWRDRDVVTRVRDQGILCGSCYAFASLHAIESQLAIQKGINVELSTQEILDCALEHGTNQCDGGYPEGVYSYINEKGGISLEKDYPYEGKFIGCRSHQNQVNVSIKSELKLFSENDEELEAFLYFHGPLYIAFDHLHDSFFRYSHGIYYEPNCSKSADYTHGALLIGYGSENGNDYWVVKNSFGVNWGEKGYIRIARNKNHHCLVGSYVVLPVLK